MKATDFLTESKKLPTSKPRNFVAKNASTGGAGQHKDKKKAEKQGDVKHKGKEFAEATGDAKFDNMMKKVAKAPTAKARNAERIRQKQEREAETKAHFANGGAFGASPADKLSIRKSPSTKESYSDRLAGKLREKMKIPFAGAAVGQKEGPAGQLRTGPAKRGQLVGEGKEASPTAELEAHLAHLEKLLPSIMKISKENHYVFEEIESEVMAIATSVEEMGDSSAAFDLTDAVDSAVALIRQANGAVYNIEKTVKSLIREVTNNIADANDDSEFESRFSNK